MDLTSTVDALRSQAPALRALGVIGLSLFGSTARGEATENSDVDVAIRLDPEHRPRGLAYIGLVEKVERALAETLGRPVDVVVEPVQRPELGRAIDEDRIVAFQEPCWAFADIIADIDFLQSRTSGFDARSLAADRVMLYAVERALSRISEAASRLGQQAETMAPEQPWGEIRALGNRIRHEYDHLDTAILWEIVQRDLPSLRATCARCIAQFASGTQGAP